MALSNILKEFLIKIGYQDVGRQAFVDGVVKTTEVVGELGVAITATAAMMLKGLEDMSQGIEKFYFMSQRIGASVANIKALGFAADQMGVGADSAYSALENLASFIRNSPQALQFLQGNLGIKTGGKDTAQILAELGDKFAQMPVYMANAYAQVLGIDERTMLALRQGMGQYLADYENVLKKVGVNEDAAAKAGHQFMLQWREGMALWGAFKDKIIELVAGKAGNYLRDFIGFVETHFRQITDVISNLIVWFFQLFGDIVHLAEDAWNGLEKLYKAFEGLPAPIRLVTEAIVGLAAAFLLWDWPLLVVAALGAGLLLLYDDYLTWQRGGKHFIDWETWQRELNSAMAGIKSWWETLKTDWKNNTYYLRTLLEAMFVIPYDVFIEPLIFAWKGLVATTNYAYNHALEIFNKITSFFENSWIGKVLKQAFLNSPLGQDFKIGAALVPYLKDGLDKVGPTIDNESKRILDGLGITGNSGVESPDDVRRNRARSMLFGGGSGSSTFESLEKTFGLPPGTLSRVRKVESNNNDYAVSKAGALGPFQLMPGTASDLGVDNPFDLKQASVGAAKYLGSLMKQFGGDIEKAYAAYNWGPGNLQKDIAAHGDNWKAFLPAETMNYIAKLDRLGGDDRALAQGPVINQENHYTINGATDTRATAAAVSRANDTSSQRLIRNLKPLAV